MDTDIYRELSITLADVLIALGKKEIEYNLERNDVDYKLCFIFKGSNVGWNLIKNLDNQKPEVWEFLLNILNNK